MTDLFALIIDALHTGKLRITIEVSFSEEEEGQGEFVKTCDRCGRAFRHVTDKKAARALRSHRQHCKSNEELYPWLKRTSEDE